MAPKPTYEELEKRVKELEEQIRIFNQSEETPSDGLEKYPYQHMQEVFPFKIWCKRIKCVHSTSLVEMFLVD